MAVNTSQQFQADVSRYLDHEVLPLAQRHLVIKQFARKATRKIPMGRGLTWTATRYNRFSLPFAPLSEGVPPIGQNLTISQVTGVALQWGDKCTITDVAEDTIEHDLFDQAIRLFEYQIPETLDRNGFLNLLSGTQVNYVNSRGSRAALVAGDVLDPTTVNRTVVNLKQLGAMLWNGESGTDVRRDIDSGAAKGADSNFKGHEHYVAVGSPLVLSGDFAQNATVQNAWSWSDIHRLYINEVGQWRGLHFVESNLTPTFLGVANTGINPTPGVAGSLATNNYFVQLTASDGQNQYESRIYQVSNAVAVNGPTGSIAITLPNLAPPSPGNPGWTFNAYIGTASSPMNLALCASGPTTGPYAGQAVQMTGNQTVILTGIGLMQVPPASPAVGVTVAPTFVFGKEAFASLELERGSVSWTYLREADKSDPNNQLRVVGWKLWDGWVLTNQNFMARIESAASNTGLFA